MSFSDEDLKKLFEPFGEIISCIVMKSDEGKSRRFGFVCFKNSKDAMKACEDLNGKEFEVDEEDEQENKINKEDEK
jgi:polyadenylate-binding protein